MQNVVVNEGEYLSIIYEVYIIVNIYWVSDSYFCDQTKPKLKPQNDKIFSWF